MSRWREWRWKRIAAGVWKCWLCESAVLAESAADADTLTPHLCVRGVGNAVALVLRLIGLRWLLKGADCGGCERRRIWLNQWRLW